MDRLPESTRTKLRSTQIITSLTELVSELFQNSLDAGASHVDVGVDCESWSCWVKDDGFGMGKDDLAVFAKGMEEGRYGSSKAYSPDSLGQVTTFGFRGEALASVADLSCLEISSRTSRSRESWSIILKNGQCLYNGPSVRWKRESPGTVACVRDAFYSLPVRRLSHPPPSRTMELIRQELETYSLAFPNVSFSLKAESSHSVDSSNDKTWRVPKTGSSLTTFRQLYGRALVEHISEIHEASADVTVEGFISLEGAHSRAYQFLYINRHPITPGDLHKIIDTEFNNSSFAKHALDEAGDKELPLSTVRRSPRKTIRKSVYVLNINIPSQDIDNCLEPSKATVNIRNKSIVSSLLTSIATSFLIKHHFLNSRLLKSAREGIFPSPSPRKRRKIHVTDLEPAIPQEPIYVNPGDDESAEDLVWTDSHTGERFVVDRRTGNSFPLGKDPRKIEDIARTRQRRTLAPAILSMVHSKPDKVAMPDWIQCTLQDNDVYTAAQQRVPSLRLASSFISDMQNQSSHYCKRQRYHDIKSHRHSSPSLQRFTADDLAGAQIINQIDNKFIACLVKGSKDASDDTKESAGPSGYSLVLIDQHAADERVRVERFLKSLCMGFLGHGENGVKMKELSPPRPILVTRHEAERLAESENLRRAFRMWGINFAHQEIESPSGADQNGYTQVKVLSVPDVVSSKLLEGNELRELVKGYIAHLEASQLFPPRTLANDDDDTGSAWLKALRWCPQELLDLINSKACRGAIMFNDPLIREQCEQLVKQLCETVFPFQCAHGRPSLVPLANVGVPISKRREKAVEWEKLRAQT